jgi:voltage-gated potassium channel Kch
MWAAVRRFAHTTGLLDARPWKALGVGMSVWIWVDALFAALLQQVALISTQSFTQDLTSFFDALYFSTITLATVGFGDIAPVSPLARALVLVEVMVGLGLLGFLLGRAVGYAPPAANTDTERR